jgi:hypothetical protein
MSQKALYFTALCNSFIFLELFAILVRQSDLFGVLCRSEKKFGCVGI